MRILLVHPEDSPRAGPWTRQSWDLLVDLGGSSRFSEEAWRQQYSCPVLSVDSFRQTIADAKLVRQIFSSGRGFLIDEEGIDWWDVTSLRIVPEALTAVALGRVSTEISPSAELWATRPGWPANVVTAWSGRTFNSFGGSVPARSAARAVHYGRVLRHFSAAQIIEIFLDKYDSGYRGRSRFAARPKLCADTVVLLPSAYGNVSRMAAAYARLVPQQSFLLVATRRSARQFVPPANVEVRNLSAYAKADAFSEEIAFLIQRWFDLRAGLVSVRELEVLSRMGVLDSFPDWLRAGVRMRAAWRQILENEPVCGVL